MAFIASDTEASSSHHSSSEDKPLPPEDAADQWARDRRLSSLFSMLVFNRRESLPKTQTHPPDAEDEGDFDAPGMAHAAAGDEEAFSSSSDHFFSADEGFEARWSQTFSIKRESASGVPQYVASERTSLLHQIIHADDLARLQSTETKSSRPTSLARTRTPSNRSLQSIRSTRSDPSLLPASGPVESLLAVNRPSPAISQVSFTSTTPAQSLFSEKSASSSSRTSFDSERLDKLEDPAAPSAEPPSLPALPVLQDLSGTFSNDSAENSLDESDACARDQGRSRSKSVNARIHVPVEPKQSRRRSRTAGELKMAPAAAAAASLLNPPVMSRTWRSTMGETEYHELESGFGPLEMRRQEVIWELCETEESFVSSLLGVSQVFFLPLRTPQGHWIRGIPTYITRLFDWFDDIVHLHAQLSRALRLMQWQQHKIVLRVAETILPFVDHLEVHQPYLARFEAVSKEIDQMLVDANSDFGEFVRMQQNLPDCGRMPLTSFLLKPLQRLMKYPLFFKQLCDLTPSAHADHLATLTLLHSTDSVIRIMQEVKAREDEYEELKALQASLRGLPPLFQLAKRDRRLLARGTLRRHLMSERDRNLLHFSSAASAGAAADSFKIGAALPLARQLSTQSLSESIAQLPRPGSTPMQHALSLPNHDKVHPVPPPTSARHLLPSSRSGLIRTKAKETPVQVFVFNDLVIFAKKEADVVKLVRQGRGEGQRLLQASYKLLDGCGLCRVLGVEDLSGRTEHDSLVEVDLLPVSSEDELTAISLCNASLATSIYLSVPDALPATRKPAPQEPQTLAGWLEAFQRSFCCALRSLSYPQHLSALSASISRRDMLDETSWRSPAEEEAEARRVSACGSILNAGLPLPKSASQQLRTPERPASSQLLDYSRRASHRTEVAEEREERGFWAVRFRKLRREMQLDEAALMEARIAMAAYGRPAGHGGALSPAGPGTRSLLAMRTSSLTSRTGMDVSRA